MQTLVQVLCSRGASLRERIVNDRQLTSYGLAVSRQLKPGRSQGWAKVHSEDPDTYGAINIEWNAASRTLLCRVVNRKRGRPANIIGDFLAYLLARHKKRIQVVSIIPR
jgi:hypothetical protein